MAVQSLSEVFASNRQAVENGRALLVMLDQPQVDQKAALELMKTSDLLVRDNDQNSVLHLTAFHGHRELGKAALETLHARDELSTLLNARNAFSDTALMLASDQGHKGNVDDLLLYKADTALRNLRNNNAASDYAWNAGHRDVFIKLETAEVPAPAQAPVRQQAKSGRAYT